MNVHEHDFMVRFVLMVRRNFVSLWHVFGVLDVDVSLSVLFNPFY